MAYSELIKNFERIRDYMRQFYVYGFKRREEYDAKSARSYDNERRRLESWLGDFMRFRQTSDGKNVFIAVDTRSGKGNPLFNAFKAKSFTGGDVTFHFYVLDLLKDGKAYTAQEITAALSERYLRHFDTAKEPDISTIRKKLKEYVTLGLISAEKQGRELLYTRMPEDVDIAPWADTAAFFSETNPLGVIGSTILDKLPRPGSNFVFKHHYMLHALDSQVLLQLATAIGETRRVDITCCGRGGKETTHRVLPLHIFVSTQGGREYLLCYHYRFRKLMFFRTDYILCALAGDEEPDYPVYRGYCEKFRENLWGTSVGQDLALERVELRLHFADNEQHIVSRVHREKRNGTVTLLDKNTLLFTADVYDASELVPWIRTFIGRIEDFRCSNAQVVRRFYEDLEQMYEVYGGEV